MQRTLRSNSSSIPSVWNIAQHQANANEELALEVEPVPVNNPVLLPVVATMTEVWKTNPFAGDFNPGTKVGHQIFTEKTKGLPEADRLALTKANANSIHSYMSARESNYGAVIRSIPIEWNADNTIKTTANLLTQHHLVKLEHVQRAALDRYSTPLAVGDAIPDGPFQIRDLDPGAVEDDKKTFYLRVHSQVVATVIKNGLTAVGFQDIMLQKKKFSFRHPTTGEIEFDGPTMMFLIFQKTQPSTIVGLDSYLKKLENCKAGDHSNDIDKMLTYMESNYEVLHAHNKVPDNYRRLLLDALGTGPNNSFNLYIDRIKDDIDSGLGLHSNIEPESIIIACRQKYTNMVELKEWNKVDPRDAQMMTLVTQLQILTSKQQAAHVAAGVPSNNQNDPKQNNTWAKKDVVEGTIVEKWRIVKDGDTKIVGGTTWHWCPHHVLAGKWDGLYSRHSSTDCPSIKGKKANGILDPAKAAAAKATGDAANAAVKSKATLDIQAKLKEVLCTNLCLSGDDVDKIFQEASAEN
jgi:hypothetical protein